MSALVSSDEIGISSSAGNAAAWSSSMSHGGHSHGANAWTMGIPTRCRRIRKVGDEFEFEAPERVHADVHWSLHVVPVAAKLRGCKGWGGRRDNADTDAAQQGRKPGACCPPCPCGRAARTHPFSLAIFSGQIRGGAHRLVRSS
ncbi:hypothetical protein EDB85DRAFT_1892975 [Lactarius pseudohatsudake]|nr:hypothetical protein EDB85DRAFT_1892975 [Lactarius pseudohatsudake]